VLRGRATIAGAALIMMAGLAIPVARALTATAAVTPTQGIDVSSLQHPDNASINWADVFSAGKAFTAIKASEGNYYTNSFYASDVKQATNVGLYVSPYVFANPYHTNGTAVSQADYAWKNVISKASPGYGSSPLMLPLMVDLEPDPYASSETDSNQCYGLSQSAMRTWIQQFLAEAKADTGKAPIIYTTAAWWNACTGDDTTIGSQGYPLWVASYGVSIPVLPSGWNNYTFWQYSDSGTVSGISVATDLDYLDPVLQATQVGKAIAAVRLSTLGSLNGQPVSYSSPTLPPGLTLSSSGQITGTPTTAGQYSVTVTPSSGAAIPITWDVHGTITVHSPGNRTTPAGTPVGLRVTATDTDPAKFTASFKASGLPPGLSINSGGVIGGWPTKPGTYKVTVSAADGLYAAGSVAFTWTVKAAADSGATGTIRQWGGSGKCLNDVGSQTANGTAVNLWSCTGKANQSWTMVQDGTVRVQGKCLQVAGGSKANGARLELWACNSGNGAQQWQVGTDSQLVNPQSGKCLYVPSSNAPNGTRPVLSSCNNSANDHWLRPTANVYSGDPGKCLAASGSTVVLANCANTSAQHWKQWWSGALQLGTKCLTEAGATSGSGLSVGSCSGAAATKWQLRPAGPIATELASAASGLCVTAPSAANGVKLVLGACSTSQAATWHVE
jgi:GH25 family lysozyme M1 (1,4-beta-N-acetylmuramidase)